MIMHEKPRCPVCWSDEITVYNSDDVICNACAFRILPNKPVEEVSVKDAALMTDKNHAILLDVRQPNEHAIARIEQAMFIPQQELPNRLDKLDKRKKIICFCHHGGRSHLVARYLIQKGFRAMNMQGGINAWSVEIDENVKKY